MVENRRVAGKRVAQFDTLRLRLIKIAAWVEVLKRQVRLHLPRATPDQAIFAVALTRKTRLILTFSK